MRDIERILEGAPSILSSGPDILAMEYEAVITTNLQVSCSMRNLTLNVDMKTSKISMYRLNRYYN